MGMDNLIYEELKQIRTMLEMLFEEMSNNEEEIPKVPEPPYNSEVKSLRVDKR